MIDQDKLLDLLLYAVNEANGWHDDSNGGGIKSPEMAQCVAVLAANGLHPRDYDDGRAFLAGWKPTKEDAFELCGGLNEILNDLTMMPVGGGSRYTIRNQLPDVNWRKMYPEVRDGQ